MKKKWWLFLLIIIAVVIPLSFIVKDKTADSYFKRKYANREVEDIYAELMEHDAHYILDEFMKVEDELGLDELEVYIPFATALLERKDEFTPSELIELLRSDSTKEGLETVLVEMYSKIEGDSDKLLELLTEPEENISDMGKYNILIFSRLDAAELLKLFDQRQDSFIGALVKQMKRKISEDDFFEKITVMFETTESEKEISACIPYLSDLYLYAKKKHDEEGCKRLLNAIDRALTLQKDEDSCSLIIGELASMEDMMIIKRIIEDPNYDDVTKVGAINNASPYFEELLSKKIDENDLAVIIEAMNLNPVKEVGEALKTAIEKGRIIETEEIRNTLELIDKEGLWQWETHYDQ